MCKSQLINALSNYVTSYKSEFPGAPGGKGDSGECYAPGEAYVKAVESPLFKELPAYMRAMLVEQE